MKSAFTAVLATILAIGALAQADDSQCQKAYGQAVATCAQNLSFLSPNVRAGAQKACVEDAKIQKDYCMNGVNVCLANCQAAYDTKVTQCESSYQAALSICFGNTVCEDAALANKSACVSGAVTTLNTCNSNCQL